MKKLETGAFGLFQSLVTTRLMISWCWLPEAVSYQQSRLSLRMSDSLCLSYECLYYFFTNVWASNFSLFCSLRTFFRQAICSANSVLNFSISLSYFNLVCCASTSKGSFYLSDMFFQISATSLAIFEPTLSPVLFDISLLFCLKKKKKLETGCFGLLALTASMICDKFSILLPAYGLLALFALLVSSLLLKSLWMQSLLAASLSQMARMSSAFICRMHSSASSMKQVDMVKSTLLANFSSSSLLNNLSSSFPADFPSIILPISRKNASILPPQLSLLPPTIILPFLHYSLNIIYHINLSNKTTLPQSVVFLLIMAIINLGDHASQGSRLSSLSQKVEWQFLKSASSWQPEQQQVPFMWSNFAASEALWASRDPAQCCTVCALVDQVVLVARHRLEVLLQQVLQGLVGVTVELLLELLELLVFSCRVALRSCSFGLWRLWSPKSRKSSHCLGCLGRNNFGRFGGHCLLQGLGRCCLLGRNNLLCRNSFLGGLDSCLGNNFLCTSFGWLADRPSLSLRLSFLVTCSLCLSYLCTFGACLFSHQSMI